MFPKTATLKKEEEIFMSDPASMFSSLKRTGLLMATAIRINNPDRINPIPQTQS